MSEETPLIADGNTGYAPAMTQITGWANALGFQHVGIANVTDFDGGAGLRDWLAQQFHGEMAYMAREPSRRAHPPELVPGTVSAIMVGMNYAPSDPNWVEQEWSRIGNSAGATVSVYARGRDYHKLVRRQLQKLADQISAHIGPFGYRAFCDSAPVMEVSLAERAGLGWRGKHTLLLNRQQGSMFFLGTLYTDLPVSGSIPAPTSTHCGSCRRCIDVCPTQAIVAPYRLDARRCISYLTIEHPGSIDPALRPLIGNRVYGCDDCQLVCPWNKFAQAAESPDFAPRHGLDSAQLIDLFNWTEAQFEKNTLGSAIRRIGFERWSRNLAVGLGNLQREAVGAELVREAVAALERRRAQATPMLAEHIDWAIGRLTH
ncbi:MAG: tRNA epoxyqueuosine(34) reductase QueG [Burkholderiaceae bacterium]